MGKRIITLRHLRVMPLFITRVRLLMKTLRFAVGVVAGLLCSSAFASTEYHYSYTFQQGADPGTDFTMSGTFWGTASGNVINHLADFTLNETDHDGHLLFSADSSQIHVTSALGDFLPPLMSFDGHDNYFQLYVPLLPNPVFNYVTFLGYGSNRSGNLYGPGLDYYLGHGFGLDAFKVEGEPSSWSLTAVSPVPEPETYALLGLGLVGLFASRRPKVWLTGLRRTEQ